MNTKRFPYSAFNEEAAAAGEAGAAGAEGAAAAEGAADVVDPATVMIVDTRTGEVAADAAQNALPAGVLPAGVTPQMLQSAVNAAVLQAQGIAAAGSGLPAALNASAAMGLLPETRLTQFAVGYPTGPLLDVANFLAPQVSAGMKFDYVVWSKGNAYATIDNDVLGIGGLPGLVVPDENSLVSATLKARGLESQMALLEEQSHNSTPGWSAELEWQDRIGFILDSQARGRIQRTLAVAAVASGAATAKTWNDAADPIGDLRGYVNTIAKLVGGKQNVRLLIGSDAFEILVNHVKLAGGTNYARQAVDEALIAKFVGIPAANVRVNYLQVTATKQGKTVTTTDLLTPAEIWIFAASQNPNRRDPSFMKTFVMMFNGAPRFVYKWNPHPMYTRRGNAYMDYIVATNSAAVQRLSISDGS